MGPQYDYQDYLFCPIAAQARAAVSPVFVLGGTKPWVRLIKVAEHSGHCRALGQPRCALRLRTHRQIRTDNINNYRDSRPSIPNNTNPIYPVRMPGRSLTRLSL